MVRLSWNGVDFTVLINVLDDVDEIVELMALLINLLAVDDSALELDWTEGFPTQWAFSLGLTPGIYALEAKFVLTTVNLGRRLILGTLKADGALVLAFTRNFWEAETGDWALLMEEAGVGRVKGFLEYTSVLHFVDFII